MKILYISPQPFFRERGTPLRTRNVVTALAAVGHEVDIVCYPFGEDIRIPGARIVRCARVPGIRDVAIGPSLGKLFSDIPLIFKAWALCRRNGYDVIEAVEELAFAAQFLKRLFRCRFIYNMDSYISEHLQFSGFVRGGPILGLARWLERRAMRAADIVVTVGSVLSDEVRRIAPGTAVLQLEDAPLRERFEEDPATAARLREELRLGDGPVVLYTGNFAVYQGVDLLVRAAAVVARQRPDARVVLAGGTPGDTRAMGALAAAVGSGEACVFAGLRPTAEMPGFLTLASILASPRNRGTNPPMKIYPYMQSGRPIVATRHPTHTQVLDDACAILTEPTPEGLAAGILRALADPDGAARLAAEARRRAAEEYGLAQFYRKVQEAYAARFGALGARGGAEARSAGDDAVQIGLGEGCGSGGSGR